MTTEQKNRLYNVIFQYDPFNLPPDDLRAEIENSTDGDAINALLNLCETILNEKGYN